MALFLFIGGADYVSIFIILVLIYIFGILVFWLSKKLLQKVQKDASDRKINILSTVCAILITPAFLIVLTHGLTKLLSKKTQQERTSYQYKKVERELLNDSIIGMSKAQIVELFGENDTTQSVMRYDLSVPNAEEKFILELKFEDGRLINFRRN